MEKDRLIIGFHIIIAIILLPAYQTLGEGFKYIVAPYVLYLVWKRDPVFLPALIIHFSSGSTISYLILLTIFVLTSINIPLFLKMKLGWLLLLALLPFTIFLYQTIMRVFVMNLGLIDTVSPLGFYLGIFPFFYGILLFPKFDESVWKALIIVLFIMPFLKFIPGIDMNIRAYWFSFPLFFTLFGSYFFWGHSFKFRTFIIYISGLFLVITVGFSVFGLKFTLIFSGCVSLLCVILSIRSSNFLLGFLTRPRTIVLAIMLVAGIIGGINKYGNVGALQGFNKEELSYFDWDDFWLLLQYKAFDDRAVIWAGGWEIVKKEDMLWPPYSPPSYSFYNARGSIISDVEFGIHNIGLELMRNYGIVVGTIITLTFAFMLIKGPGKLLLNKKLHSNNYLIIFSATCLGVGWVGGLVGQHVLMPTFSLLLMGLSGVMYGQVVYSNVLATKNDQS